MTFIKPYTTSSNYEIVATTRSVTWADGYKTLVVNSGITLTFDVSTATGVQQIDGFTLNVFLNDPTAVLIVKVNTGTYTYTGTHALQNLTVVSDGGADNVWINGQNAIYYLPMTSDGFAYELLPMIVTGNIISGFSCFQRLPNKYFTVTAQIEGRGAGSDLITFIWSTFPSKAANSLQYAATAGTLNTPMVTSTGAPGSYYVVSSDTDGGGLNTYFNIILSTSDLATVNIILSGRDASLTP